MLSNIVAGSVSRCICAGSLNMNYVIALPTPVLSNWFLFGSSSNVGTRNMDSVFVLSTPTCPTCPNLKMSCASTACTDAKLVGYFLDFNVLSSA